MEWYVKFDFGASSTFDFSSTIGRKCSLALTVVLVPRGGADCVGGSRPEASGRALASTTVNPEQRDEHHRE